MNFFFVNVAHASLNSFLGNVDNQIINPLIKLLFALALVYFLFGVFEFMANAEDEEKKTAGKSHMLWGIIGLTIMFGVWSILNIVLNTLNIRGIDPKNSNVELNEYNPSTPNHPVGNN